MYTEPDNRQSLESLTNNQSSAADFLQRCCDTINAGAQAVMISIGHKSGLFDTMSQLDPASSQEIADQASLNERYVREWLAVMVTANIVNYAPQNNLYYLPATHAACLTRDASLGNAAVFAQHIALMGALEDQTLHCLKNGGGTEYGDYPCFHQIMSEDSEQTVVNSLFETILPIADGIEDRLHSGIEVLDIGCGMGYALIAMAKRYPQSRFTGYDLCEDAIEAASELVSSSGLANIRFAVSDMADFNEVEGYDFITTFDAIHDQRNPAELITRIHQALNTNGIYLMQDIGGSAQLENNLDFPMASLLYAISCMHCTPISIGQGGEGLGTMWGWETAQRMLEQAGFKRTEPRFLAHDPMNVWFISSKG